LTSSDQRRFLVTGAYGCIGAWVVRDLLERGDQVVTLDLGGDPYRIGMLVPAERLDAVEQVPGDITDLETVERTLAEHDITNVIHLAALQVPFCRADPPLGARVNVVGTVNVFESAKRRGGMAPIVYASSIAAYDAIDAGSLAADMRALPSTIYGVYKRANEGTAHVYWADHRVSSIGLRPHTVFGPGRDQGLTSQPTRAMLAAAAGQPFHMTYGGRSQLQYAPDVARAFVAASVAQYEGESVHNLAGQAVHMDEVVAAIERAEPAAAGSISYDAGTLLPFPEEVASGSLEAIAGALPQVAIEDAVADSVARFHDLLERGLISAEPAGQSA
jgi:nucleoside-diphosphate-sugar epimerase